MIRVILRPACGRRISMTVRAFRRNGITPAPNGAKESRLGRKPWRPAQRRCPQPRKGRKRIRPSHDSLCRPCGAWSWPGPEIGASPRPEFFRRCAAPRASEYLLPLRWRGSGRDESSKGHEPTKNLDPVLTNTRHYESCCSLGRGEESRHAMAALIQPANLRHSAARSWPRNLDHKSWRREHRGSSSRAWPLRAESQAFLRMTGLSDWELVSSRAKRGICFFSQCREQADCSWPAAAGSDVLWIFPTSCSISRGKRGAGLGGRK